MLAADRTPPATGRHVLSAGMGAFTRVDVVVGYDLGLVCGALPRPRARRGEPADAANTRCANRFRTRLP